MRDLIEQYKVSLRLLRRSKISSIYRSKMISDIEWVIQYMETGMIPGAKWSVARWSKVKREIPVDPLKMTRFIRNREPVSAAPGWMAQLVNRLISGLTAREREAFELVRGQCYSFAQAGKLMGCAKGTVQNLVLRAEKKIAHVVRKQTMGEEGCFGTQSPTDRKSCCGE